MARSRNIKPSFFTSDALADISPFGRLLFIGLWTVADREGRLEDRPRRIKAEILPYDNVNIDKTLESLQSAGFIERYEVDGERYIQVTNFTKHQNPHMKEAASTIPAPCKHGTSTVQEQEKHDTSPADSLNPLIDSLNLIPETPIPTRKRDEADPRFDQFWSAYPLKKSKPAAVKAFAKVNWKAVDFDSVMASLEAHKQSAQWCKDGGQFIPHPATWLNGERWADEITADVVSKPANSQTQALIEQARREEAEEYEKARGNTDIGSSQYRMAGEADHSRDKPSLLLGAGRRAS